MPEKTVQKLHDDPLKQFSIFLENKVGRFIDIIQLLESHNTHVVALTVLDTTDSAIVRLVLDDPDRGRDLLKEHSIAATESDVLGVELDAVTDLHKVLTSLLRAEINIFYIYSFLNRPHGKAALILQVDDAECAVHALIQNQFKILRQRDIAR